MNAARHIGIVGVSAEGAALCYRTICAEGADLLGPHNHPQVTMHTYPLADYMGLIEANLWQDVGLRLLASAELLLHAGAEVLVCPDNTVHQALDLVSDQARGQWLHIAGDVAAVASRCQFHRLGILGTRYLMDGPVYAAKLAARGIAHEIPDIQDREQINAIIFDELVHGRPEVSSRQYFLRVIEALGNRGCDAVILGCTELPLLIAESESPLPVIDSTRTLARAALRAAIQLG